MDATEAKAIVQAVLTDTGQALLAGDFDRFAAPVLLPYATCTQNGAKLLHTVEDLRDGFDTVRQFYLSRNVTSLVRTVTEARFVAPDRIRAASTAKAMAGDTPLAETHHVVTHMQRCSDGAWRITDARYSFRGACDGGETLLGAGIFEDTEPAGTSQALALLQNILDRIARAYTLGEFALLRDAVTLPIFKQGVRGAEIFDTLESLRRDFDTYMLRLTTRNVTELFYSARCAQFLGDRRLHGSFRTDVLSGTQMLVPSYTSAVTLEADTEAQWRLTSIMHPADLPTLDRIVHVGDTA